jgi:glutaredoxin
MRNPVRLTLLSREDCHLCEVAHRIALHLQSELPIEVRIVDVDGDDVLRKRYGTRVPVVLLNDIEQCSGNVTEEELRRAIKKRGEEDR